MHVTSDIIFIVSTLIDNSYEGRIQNMDPGPWTTHVDPVHGPPMWTRSMDHPCGPGPWTTPPILSGKSSTSYLKFTIHK